MTTPTISLEAHPRSLVGKKVKRLRGQGQTPIHLFGRGLASQALQAETATLRRVLVRAGKNRPVSLQIEGDKESYLAFVREIQFHPLTEEVLHVDFYRVETGIRLQVEVPINLVGEASAVAMQGAWLVQTLRSLLVECLPLEVPEAITVDVSHLESFDQAIRVKELQVPSGVAVLTDPEQLVVQVARPQREEVAAVEEKAPEAAAEEGQEPEGGEAPAE